MELQIKVKASGVNNLSDARYFAPFAEWVGLPFDTNNPTNNALTVDVAKEIMGWLSGPRIVGEFGAEPMEVINKICEELMIDTIQITKDIDATKLSPKISTIIKRIVINDLIDEDRLESMLSAGSGKVAYFVLDFVSANPNITWQQIQLHEELHPDLLSELCAMYPIMLQLPLTPNNVHTVLELVPDVHALNLAGGNEISVGVRAFDDIDPIIEQLEIDDDW